jgi:hypothetical protein
VSAIPGLKGCIGATSTLRRANLSEKEMRDFADCVRATLGNTSHSAITSTAVPTIFTLFREGEFELLKSFGIELKQVLHAEQEYRIEAPLSYGEEIRYATTLSAVAEKKGKDAHLAFLVFETPFERVSDSVRLGFAKSTIVYREPKSGDA